MAFALFIITPNNDSTIIRSVILLMITLYDSDHYLMIVSVRYEVLRIIIFRWYVNYKYNTYIQLLRTNIKSNNYRTDWQMYWSHPLLCSIRG
jgi:hypothetical protein